MKCRGWNPQIALYVEGDLELESVAHLEKHLEVCVECRAFLDELRNSQSEVRQLRNETVDASSLNRVRANVMRQVRAVEERRTWMDHFAIWLWGGYRWRFAVLGSVVLMATSIVIWRLASPTMPPSPPTIAIAPAPAPVPSVDVPAAAERSVTRSAPVRRSRPVASHPVAPKVATLDESPVEPQPEESKDTVVQILTDDPNIVIYWLFEKNGGF